MRATNLKVANLRAIEAAEFRFRPGFNLVVGVNGVGKTTVLDALRIGLSNVVKHINGLRYSESFSVDDIRVEGGALTVQFGIEIGGSAHEYVMHVPREGSVPQEKKSGMPREDVHLTPSRNEFVGDPPVVSRDTMPGGRPFAIFFSTSRAVPSERDPSVRQAGGDVAAALAGALTSRPLQLGVFAKWMRVQTALRREKPAVGNYLDAVESVVQRFLPGFARLRVEDDDRPRLRIDRGRTTLDVRQLSDGERGTLALVLDLTRRLAQANPELIDPAGEAEAVVLIDEIDLHLHPQWQRRIVQNLTAAFPKCQFITTTHSPQIVGEVQHDCIQVIADGAVYSPMHSFGVDASRVLEEIMDARPRTEEVDDLLARLSRFIGNSQLGAAREALAELVNRLGEDDPEVTRMRTLLEFVEGD